MKNELNQAIELIKATNDRVSRLIDKIQDDWDEKDHDLAHKVYVIASYLDECFLHLHVSKTSRLLIMDPTASDHRFFFSLLL